MKDKVFIDTNVLIYLYSEDELQKRESSKNVFEKYNCITSTQTLNELSNVLIKKFKVNPTDVLKAIDEVCLNCDVVEVSVGTVKKALQLLERYGYSYYDSLIVSAALENECKFLITEDMHDGQSIENSLTIKNVFVM